MWRQISRVVLVLSVGGCLAGAGCRRGDAPEAKQGATAVPTAASVQVAVGAGRRAEGEKAQECVAIPAGRFFAGSVPGDDGRDPTLEPIAASYDLPAFSIDALPYPGIPGTPAKTGVTAGEAAKLCAERGERLCTELEWERACRGPNGDLFSTGPAWDPTCTKTADACVSGYGVRAMGALIEEWTASSVADSAGGKPRAAVKGAYATSPAAGHRCAARHAVDPTVSGKPIGFRCCKGPAPQTSIAAIEAAPTFRRTTLDSGKLAQLVDASPELSRVRGARLFKETDINDVLDKAKSPPGEALTVTVDPILWSPEPGTELLVVTGRGKGGAFVAAFHVLPGDKYRLASSLVFANEQGPIVLAYQGNLHREILWSMAWGSAGEGGAVAYRDDHRAVVVQR